MRTAFKVIGSIVAILIVLFIVTTIILTKVVNPNDYKNRINQMVFDKTGRHLLIKGNMSWSFVPWLGIDLKNVAVTNPSDFQGPNFMDMDEIKINVRFWPLLTGKMQLGNIAIDHARVNLITNKAGNSNWAQWNKPANPAAPSTLTTPTPPQFNPKKSTAPIKNKTTSMDIQLGNIEINDSTINVIDQKQNTTSQFSDFNFKVIPLSTSPYYSLQWNFTAQPSGSNVKINVRGADQAFLDFPNNHFYFDKVNINAKITRPRLPDVNTSLTGTLDIDLNKDTASASPLTIEIANMKTVGKIQVSQLLQTPQYIIQLSANNTSIQPLVTALRGSSFIAGNLSFNTELNTRGTNKQAILSNLNGKGQMTVDNGALLDVNIQNLLAQGDAILNHKQLPQNTGPNQTSFKQLSGSFEIDDGILNNNDLKLDGGEVQATGNGTVNLIDNTVNYALAAQYMKNGSQSAEFSVPIRITGSLTSPSIKPDFSSLARKILTNEIKQKIKDYTSGIGKQFNLNKLLH